MSFHFFATSNHASRTFFTYFLMHIHGVVSAYMLRSGLAMLGVWVHLSLIASAATYSQHNFAICCQMVLQTGCISLHSQQQATSSPHLHQPYNCQMFKFCPSDECEIHSSTVVLICILLITCENKTSVISLLAIQNSSSVNYLAYFSIELFFFFLLICAFLSVICVTNIFFQCKAYFSFCFMVFFL